MSAETETTRTLADVLGPGELSIEVERQTITREDIDIDYASLPAPEPGDTPEIYTEKLQEVIDGLIKLGEVSGTINYSSVESCEFDLENAFAQDVIKDAVSAGDELENFTL